MLIKASFVLFIVLCLGFGSVATLKASKDENEFDAIESFCDSFPMKYVKVYYFTSKNCAPCAALQPKIEEIKKKRPHFEIVVLEENEKKSQELAQKFAVSATPTFVCVRVDLALPVGKNEEVFDKWSGGKDLEKKIKFVYEKGIQDETR